MHIYIYVYIYIYMNMYTYIFIHMYTYPSIRINIYMHISINEIGLVKTSVEGSATKEIDLFSDLKTIALRVLKDFLATGIYKKCKGNMNENNLFHEKIDAIFKILLENVRLYGGEVANNRMSRKIAAAIDVLGCACVNGGNKGA
jgi:hypothetical protein